MRAVLVCAWAVAVVGCDSAPVVATDDAAPSSITTIAAPTIDNDAAVRDVRGVGWYPNVEVDAAARVHVAWVDADRGDVIYAHSAKGGDTIERTVTVDSAGSVGAFLRLALADETPMFLYGHQDLHVLRLARGSQRRGDDIGFGKAAGRSACVTSNGKDTVVAYYSADDRLRLVLSDKSKRDVDTFARGSMRTRCSVLVLDDGAVVVAYADDAASHMRARVVMVDAQGVVHRVMDEEGQSFLPTLIRPVDDLEGVTLMFHDGRTAMAQRLDVASRTWSTRDVLVKFNGEAKVQRKHGGFFVLARVHNEGMFVYDIDDAGPERIVRRTRLASAIGREPSNFFDVAVRAGSESDRPIAVWFDDDDKSLKLYAP